MSDRRAVVERDMGDAMWTVRYYEGSRRIGLACYHFRWSARWAARRFISGLSGPRREEIR